MSNPNWPDDSQLYPGTPAQQPAPQQPANPTPFNTDPNAPARQDSPYGQTPMPPIPSPYDQPASAQPGYGQQPPTPNPYSYGAPPSAPFGQPYAPQPMSPGVDQTNQGGMMPGMGDPYAQPATPMPPYGYPGTPSQQLPGYQGNFGYPGTPSQALPGYQGTPSQQLPGYPGSPSQALYGQPAAPSMPMYGQPQWGMPSQTLGGGAPATKRSKKPLFIALAIVAVLLLLVGGGAAYVVNSLGAPAVAATQFCGDLKAQNYSAAYGMFSSTLRGTYSSDLFTKGAQALDAVEGTVTQCDKAAGSNAYTYSFGASTATLQAVMTRGKQGQLTGQILLKNENGSWKVDSLDTSLLGINLSALQTVNGFCQALQTGDYETAYGILGTTPQGAISESDFVTNAKLDDKYDGTLSACSLVTIGTGNTDTATTLTVSVTRAKLGAKTGNVALDVESGAWKIATIDTSILGSDYRPLLVAQAFCTDYQKNDLTKAYGLMAPDAGVSKSDFIAWFQLPSGIALTQCGVNVSSYKVTGTTASVQVNITIADPSTGATLKANIAFHFTLEQEKWWISDLPQFTLA
ncbi:MAG TPA: hypothetical protein VKQ30_07730 [Ktedonobacterales bacterium]|nr:hypothetical protein [Ktedonobacterales bacterium]